jgi:hypothetical protein
MAPELDETVFGVVGVTPAVLRGVYAALPSDLLDDAVDDCWSPRYVLAHLLDTEDVIVGRLRRLVAEDRPLIQSIDAPARVNQSGYLADNVESLLSEFEARHIENIAWLRKLSAAQLARLGEHDTAGEISAADHAYQWAYHDLMHLKQAVSMVQHRLERGMGNTLRFTSTSEPSTDRQEVIS